MLAYKKIAFYACSPVHFLGIMFITLPFVFQISQGLQKDKHSGSFSLLNVSLFLSVMMTQKVL